MAVTKMDWQKNILLAAILSVLFLLVIRWNDYSEQHPAPTAIAAQTQTAPANSNSEIPSAIPLPTTTNVKETTAVASTSIIKVKTDTLLVEINPVGGDIVRIALPKHSADISTPDIPFVLMENNAEHTYIAQSGIVGTNGTDTVQGRPTFSVAQTEYTLENGKDQLVVDLTLQQYQINITKRFTFTREKYLVGVEYIIDNQTPNKWIGSFYAQIKRDDKQFAKANAMSLSPFLGAAITTPEEKYKKFNFEDIAEKDFKATVEGGWISMVQHYFISAWIPDNKSTNTYNLRKLSNQNMYIFGFTSNPIEIFSGGTASIKASFYAGPKDTESLEKISPYLDLTVDYGWLWMIAKPLFWLLKFIHGFVGNWGLAIIGLTLIIKAAFFHLSATSYKSMAKMKKLTPKMQELKERYGDDRQKMSQETMKLYQTEKVNPLGGCLPMLIQMPVFLALYWVLSESVELRHSPFYFWIVDLSIKDPYYVLPIIYGITMWFMQKLNPQPADPMQARVMQMLPIVFTFMFLWFPSGLVLYWITNNVLSMAQQYVINKQIENADTKA